MTLFHQLKYGVGPGVSVAGGAGPPVGEPVGVQVGVAHPGQGVGARVERPFH